MNGGGLRADLPAGELTYGALFRALPFDNHLAILEVPGRTVRAIVSRNVVSGHGALSFSGVHVRLRGCEVESIEVHGRALQDDATYRIVTNDYLAGGGSGFDAIAIPPEQITILWDRPVLRDVVRSFIVGRSGPIDPSAFYDPEHPRVEREGTCPVDRRAGS
jgi:2',3'-cyclic-nucleotide 2'-phosphodiesterase (5'-nucleotidase family)